MNHCQPIVQILRVSKSPAPSLQLQIYRQWKTQQKNSNLEICDENAIHCHEDQWQPILARVAVVTCPGKKI